MEREPEISRNYDYAPSVDVNVQVNTPDLPDQDDDDIIVDDKEAEDQDDKEVAEDDKETD